jgi:RNA polymerase sigma factor (TIGR02999 family)
MLTDPGRAAVAEIRDTRKPKARAPHSARELLPLVYSQLRRLAARKLVRAIPGETLQPTSLVHEAYLRLAAGGEDQLWDNCGHFYAAAAEAMRRILLDRARDKKRLKRGGGRRRKDLNLDELFDDDAPPDELIDLDEAITRLASVDSQAAALVNLRVFAGLTLADAAHRAPHRRPRLGLRPRLVIRAAAFRRRAGSRLNPAPRSHFSEPPAQPRARRSMSYRTRTPPR